MRIPHPTHNYTDINQATSCYSTEPCHIVGSIFGAKPQPHTNYKVLEMGILISRLLNVYEYAALESRNHLFNVWIIIFFTAYSTDRQTRKGERETDRHGERHRGKERKEDRQTKRDREIKKEENKRRE